MAGCLRKPNLLLKIHRIYGGFVLQFALAGGRNWVLIAIKDVGGHCSCDNTDHSEQKEKAQAALFFSWSYLYDAATQTEGFLQAVKPFLKCLHRSAYGIHLSLL